MAERPAPPGRRKTIIRTDSAPCDLSEAAKGIHSPITSSASAAPPPLSRVVSVAADASIETLDQLQPPMVKLRGNSSPSLLDISGEDGTDTSSLYETASEEEDDDEDGRARRTKSRNARAKDLDTSTPTQSSIESICSPSFGAPSPPRSTPLLDSIPAISLSRASLASVRSSTSGPPSGLPPPLSPSAQDALSRLDVQRMFQWVLCFAVVNFDLELGQALECLYPPFEFSDAERKNISFSAFPDSNSSAHVGDSTFTFRMRAANAASELYRSGHAPLPFSHVAAKLHMGASMPVDTDGYTYGYVFFRQQRDSVIRRGYFQKSLVILSPHPWPGLFTYLAGALGSRYMDAVIEDRQRYGTDATIVPSAASALLESACASIASWPAPPSALSTNVAYYPIELTLPFLGHANRFAFPPSAYFAQLFESRSQPAPDTVASPTPVARRCSIVCTPGRLYSLFSGSLELLWVCWELMITGQSLLVVAESPKACSDIVWGLIELVKPLPFGGDFRPYFTIQDSDFKGIASRQRLPSTAMILGVTNPVFTKVLEHWPNVIRAARPASVKMNGDHPPHAPSPQSGVADASGHVFGSGPLSRAPSPFQSSVPCSPKAKHISSPSSLFSALSSSPKPPLPGHMPMREQEMSTSHDGGRNETAMVESLTCKHKSYLSKDRKLIKEVVESAIRGRASHILDNMLRRHFIDLNERFIQPLNRYFESLVVGNPSHMSLSNLRTRPEIKPFKQDMFLKSVESQAATPAPLPVNCKRPRVDLYRAFLHSANFAAWLQYRTEETYREWRRRYIEVLCADDVADWALQKLSAPHAHNPHRRRHSAPNVECVDLMLRLRDEVVRYSPYFDQDPPSTPATSSPVSKRSFPSPELPSHPPLPRPHQKPKFLDLSTSHNGWASSLCAAAPSPSSPGPVNTLGGVIPTPDQFAKLKLQLEILVSVLPEGLREAVVVGGGGQQQRVPGS
ncbi:hypothetical protein DFS34DRAFT_627620 [Phlyctochytrium arcticum]|nr:hypothetical protein DFS34DRAFT_627620 [Phlyctochytrium arcticum]